MARDDIGEIWASDEDGYKSSDAKYCCAFAPMELVDNGRVLACPICGYNEKLPVPSPGKRGPKRKFVRLVPYQNGAPRLATRVDPDVLEFIQSRVDGVRQYIQRIVREDRDRPAYIFERGL